ncbi:MAG: hypothetical protein ACRDCI_11180 [Plesiomonas shigelloides]
MESYRSFWATNKVDYNIDISHEAQSGAVYKVKQHLKEKVERELSNTLKAKVNNMQQGYFDQCNDIISNLEETLSALQLTVSDLHAWAFGGSKSESEVDLNPVDGVAYVQSRVMQNRLIDALEHATAILSDANEVQIFMMGGGYEGAADDWVDDLQQSAQASPVKQAKPETLEAVEVARKIVDDRKMIMIGKHDVPAPFIGTPIQNQILFYPCITASGLTDHITWQEEVHSLNLAISLQQYLLQRKLLHTSKEAAIAHAKALIAVSKGE